MLPLVIELKTQLMGVRKKLAFVLYRYAERGIEVLLVQPETSRSGDRWMLPETDKPDLQGLKNIIKSSTGLDVDDADCLELEPFYDKRGELIHHVYAIETELKSSIKGTAKSTVKGSYFLIKEAIRNVLPGQYAQLKELKDILVTRNMLRNI